MATSNTESSYPQIFNPDPSGGEQLCGMFVVGNSSTPRLADLNSLKITQPGPSSRRALKSKHATSIEQTASQALVSASDISGYVALDLGAVVAEGDVICISGAFPLGSCYTVISVSGNVAQTDTKWSTCFAPSGGETWTSCSGNVDPAMQTGWINVSDTCRIPQTNGKKAEINTFTSRVYTDCWQCFCGEVDPCDISFEEIVLWDDESRDTQDAYHIDVEKPIQGSVRNGSTSDIGADNAQNN